MTMLTNCGDFVRFFLAVIRRLPAAATRPALVLQQAARAVGSAAPLAAMVGFCLGAVAWLHAGLMLKRFEASAWLPTVLMTAVVLEFGPIAVGLLAASRLASGLAAELAAMKATEQIDALQLLGVCPVLRLAAPRTLALVAVLPPMTVLVDYASLGGGLAAELAAGDLSWQLFVRQGIENLRFAEMTLATLKTAVFGLLVATAACWQGLRCEPDTAAVGAAATKAVLWSTLAVLVANVFLVRAIQLAVRA